MFKKFTKEENVSSTSNVKSSIQRDIRAKICEQMPGIVSIIDDVLPKKTQIFLAKCANHINIAVVDNKPLFFCDSRNEIWMPTLKLLHMCKNFLY